MAGNVIVVFAETVATATMYRTLLSSIIFDQENDTVVGEVRHLYRRFIESVP